jgi:hypothetical protein
MPEIFGGKRRREVTNMGLEVTGAQVLGCKRKTPINDCLLT